MAENISPDVGYKIAREILAFYRAMEAQREADPVKASGGSLVPDAVASDFLKAHIVPDGGDNYLDTIGQIAAARGEVDAQQAEYKARLDGIIEAYRAMIQEQELLSILMRAVVSELLRQRGGSVLAKEATWGWRAWLVKGSSVQVVNEKEVPQGYCRAEASFYVRDVPDEILQFITAIAKVRFEPSKTVLKEHYEKTGEIVPGTMVWAGKRASISRAKGDAEETKEALNGNKASGTAGADTTPAAGAGAPAQRRRGA